VIRDTLVRKLRSIERHDLADTIDECHRDPFYRRCSDCRKVKTFFNRCENFYCPLCAARLARDRRESVKYWADLFYQPKHIVLTVKSVEKLTKEYVRKLKADFRKLRTQQWCKEGERWQILPEPGEVRAPGKMLRGKKMGRRERRAWRGDPLFASSSKWRGGFWSLDATYHKDIEPGHTYESNGTRLIATEPVKRGWHVHFHVLVDADFVNQDRLSTEWAKLRGQDVAVVRVYNVKGKDYTNEVCKYVCDGVQLGTWPAEKLAEFCDALSKERCFDTFGALYRQRAEWKVALAEIHSDRQVCECGSCHYDFFSAQEWEWQQAKSSLAPPAAPKPKRVEAHPEFFAPAQFRPVFV